MLVGDARVSAEVKILARPRGSGCALSTVTVHVSFLEKLSNVAHRPGGAAAVTAAAWRRGQFATCACVELVATRSASALVCVVK